MPPSWYDEQTDTTWDLTVVMIPFAGEMAPVAVNVTALPPTPITGDVMRRIPWDDLLT